LYAFFADSLNFFDWHKTALMGKHRFLNLDFLLISLRLQGKVTIFGLSHFAIRRGKQGPNMLRILNGFCRVSLLVNSKCAKGLNNIIKYILR
jgi:hypothetical protein